MDVSSPGVPYDFGIDLGPQESLTDAIQWAVNNEIQYIDVSLLHHLEKSDNDDDLNEVRNLCEKNNISLGLHTLSAVNTAEIVPTLIESVFSYLTDYIDFAENVNADRVIVHAGYHFSADEDIRRDASFRMLDQILQYAEQQGIQILLENMNPEPPDAEVHYLCSQLEDVKTYLNQFQSPNLNFAFNPPHAHLHEGGIDGYINQLDFEECREVRLNDNRGIREEHLMPGDGTIDFPNLFEKLEKEEYDGPFIIALGPKERSLTGINRILGFLH